jgi:CDP-6-deoxy-D-xylo-4-hexulose-3-dehydrase
VDAISPIYPLANSSWDHDELRAIERVVKSANFTMGTEVSEFESDFAKKFGSDFSVMFNSGSSANLGLLAGLKYMKNSKLNDGDEILVPAVSWSTTYYPIHQLNMKLSFVDIDLDTLNIDTNRIEDAITPKTKAIFAVNLLGNPCDFEELYTIADKYNLLLIEDNCESMGAKYKEKFTGTLGLGGTFSTFFSHHISTMEGGLVTTNDICLYEAMISLRAHGWLRNLPLHNSVYNKSGDDWEDSFKFVLPGYNLRPIEMEGAIGKEQLKKIDKFLEIRQLNAKFLLKSSERLSNFKFQKEIGQSSWFGFSIILTNKLIGKRKELVATLNEAGIESRPVVTGNFTRNPVIRHLNHVSIPELPNANLVHDNGLFVGNHHYELDNEIEILTNTLFKFEERYG